MNSLWTKIFIRKLLQSGNNISVSPYMLAKRYRRLCKTVKREVKHTVLIIAGIFSASFGFKGFLLTNHFIDGGATGISLLLSVFTNIPFYLLILCVNIPFIVLAYLVMGRQFAVKTALAIAGLALCLAFIHFPNVTNDNLLVAVFGGFFLGSGIGLAVRGGAVIDGTEVLAIFLSRKLKTSMGSIIIGINIVIFSIAAYFLSVEIALYSMITYLAASTTLDFLVEGINEYMGVTIVSSRSEEIRQMLIFKMGQGVTIYNGKRGYRQHGQTMEVDIIYTVITRLELNKLNAEIDKIDPNAFIVTNKVKNIKGGVVKKRPLNH